jgi:CheY-like chemotaxis protein
LNKVPVIVIAEDDEGHAILIRRNLRRAGIRSRILHFIDGEQTLNYLLESGRGKRESIDASSCLLLLDIRMPKVDGITILQMMKQNRGLQDIPVVVITTTDDPHEIDTCYKLGCRSYLVKPVSHENFIDVFRELGITF